MACEICGRSSCTRCFHSLSEQEEFDTKTGRYAPEEDAPLKNVEAKPEQPTTAEELPLDISDEEFDIGN